MPFQLSKINHDDYDPFFFSLFSDLFIFVYLFIYFSKPHYGNKTSETTKVRNLKFGQIISLYMNLRPSDFGGATSRGFGHMHPKLVTAKFIK